MNHLLCVEAELRGRFIKAATKSLNKAVTLKHTPSFTQDSPENKDYSM